MEYMLYIKRNQVIFEAFLIMFGIFIMGVLFGAIMVTKLENHSVYDTVQDQCDKFGAFYIDENTKYQCEASQ